MTKVQIPSDFPKKNMDQNLWRSHSLSPQLTPARATALFESTIRNPFLTSKILTETLPKIFLIRNMVILILNLLSESIFDFGTGQTAYFQFDH